MTDDEKERDAERRLTELFDRSAGELSAPERAKFLRRASDIGRVARRAPPGGAFVWIPALAAAAAVVYLIVPKRHPEPANAGASASNAPIARESSPAASNLATERAEPQEPEDFVATVLAGDPSELEPLDLGPLMGETEHAANADRGNRGRMWRTEATERSVR